MRKVLFITEEFDTVYDIIEEYFEKNSNYICINSQIKEAYWEIDDIYVKITTNLSEATTAQVDSIFLDQKYLDDENIYNVALRASHRNPSSIQIAIEALEKLHYNELKRKMI